MTNLLLVFLGAGLGGVLRYAIVGGVHALIDHPFPSGTLVVNVIGCLAIGFLGAAFTGPVPLRDEYRLVLLVGVLGGFTTFSTFGSETFTLATDRAMLTAGLNLLLSNGLGLTAVWLGTKTASRLFGA